MIDTEVERARDPLQLLFLEVVLHTPGETDPELNLFSVLAHGSSETNRVSRQLLHSPEKEASPALPLKILHSNHA